MSEEEPISSPITANDQAIQDAKVWFGPQDEFEVPNTLGKNARGKIQLRKLLWDDALVHEGGNVIEIPLDYNFHPVPSNEGKSIENVRQKQKDSFYRVILKSDQKGGFRPYILKFYPNKSASNHNQLSLTNYSELSPEFSGKVELTEWNEKLIKAWKVSDGKVISYITPISARGKSGQVGINLSQNGCTNYTETYCYMYEDPEGIVIECYEETPVVECDQDSAYEDGIDGGSNWNQNDWHGFWPGFGSGSSSSELADLQSKISSEFENLYRNRMTITELQIFDNLSRLNQLRYLNNALTAQELAEYLYPEETLAGGCGDAFRHSYFNGLNVGSLGFETAKALGDAHEVNPGNNGNDRLMDLYNNELGRNLAWSLLNQGYNQTFSRELWQSLVVQGHNGKFKIIQNGNLIFGTC